MENFHSRASAAGISLILRSRRAGVVEEDQLRHLLGDRRAALDGLAGLHVDEQRARRALQVDAEVPVEAAVLGGDDRVDEVGRDVLGAGDAELLPAPGEGLAVGVDERHRPALAGVEEVVEVGKLVDVPGGARREHERRRPPPSASRPTTECAACARAMPRTVRSQKPGRGLDRKRRLPVWAMALFVLLGCFAGDATRKSAEAPAL